MSKFAFFQAQRNHCHSSSSVLGAGSLYVVSSTIIQMVSSGVTSREFAVWLTPCLHEVYTAFFSSRLCNFFRNLSPHRCARNFERHCEVHIFWYPSVLWNYYAYTYTAFSITFLAQFVKRTAIHSLVCLLRSLVLTTCSVIVQTPSTIWQFSLTKWPEDHKIDA